MGSPSKSPGGGKPPSQNVTSATRTKTVKGKEIENSIPTHEEIAANQAELYWEAENRMPKMPNIPIELNPKMVKLQSKAALPSENPSMVESNFFHIKMTGLPTLHKYSIALGKVGERVPTNREYKRRLIHMILTNDDSKPTHSKWATDYESVVISTQELFQDSLDIDLDTVRNTTTGTDSFQCTFRYLGLVEIGKLREHVFNGTNVRGLEDVLRALNVITWKLIRDGSLDGRFQGGIVGKRFYPEELVDRESETAKLYDPKEEKPRLFVVRQGFFSSVRPGPKKTLLNVKPAVSAFFASIRLETWVQRKWPEGFPTRGNFSRALKGVRVVFDHDVKQQSRAIWSYGETMKKQKFEKKKGQKHTSVFVYDYMREAYKEEKGGFDPLAVCINVGNADHPTWYPINKLTICDWQMVKTAMKEDPYVGEMVALSKLPHQSKSALLNSACVFLGLRTISEDGSVVAVPASFYEDFNMAPVGILVKTESKELLAPELAFADKRVLVRNGSWSLKETNNNYGSISFFTKVKSYKRLLVISFAVFKNNQLQTPDEWVKKLNGNLPTYGIAPKFNPSFLWEKMRKKNPYNPNSLKYREWVCDELTKAFDILKKKGAEDFAGCPILIILPEKSPQLYADVKWWGDCFVGVPTVCVVHTKLGKFSPDAIANVCLKFNLKLQGISHKVLPKALPGTKSNKNASPEVVPTGTMVVGADVTHPSISSDGCPSIAAVVGTTSERAYHYLGSTRLQKSKGEYIEDLRGMMKERFLAWYHANSSRFPQSVLFYRDGVSESQYGKVLHEEMPQIMDGYRDACQDVGEDASSDSNFKLTLVVVTKRHHARFYPEADPREKDLEEKWYPHNLPAGTVVDTGVIAPNQFNFYLQSHASPLGTAKSAHYIVLYDDNNYDVKTLQERTNNLCYVSARATKALSVCAPARFADILCDRLRCYMRFALDGTIRVDEPNHKPKKATDEIPAAKPEEWAKNDRIWWQELSEGRYQPWHVNLDNIMFYL